MSSTAVPRDSSVKHRACDECRTRKLACSKDPDGCGRCKKENLPCHYSEQKPMGRPRKRQIIESQAPSSDKVDVEPTHTNEPLYSTADDSYNGSASTEPYFTSLQELEFNDLQTDGEALNPQASNDIPAMWNFGGGPLMAGPPINFGINGFAFNEYPTPPQDPVAEVFGYLHAPTTNEKNQPQPVACSCLASMYLALSSLQQFPQDIVAALKLVRSAAATAAGAIWCPQCGNVFVESPDTPLDAFQNMMLLGTILPIIANGYSKLLRMVDEETNAAITTGQNKVFKFLDYGGICPQQRTVEETAICMEKELSFQPVQMPPLQWRTTVRALLRVDIYGHEDSIVHHKGLKDLVSEIELRQRTRHHIMDARLAAGQLDASGNGGVANAMCSTARERKHACLEILKLAKIAVDSLVIA